MNQERPGNCERFPKRAQRNSINQFDSPCQANIWLAGYYTLHPPMDAHDYPGNGLSLPQLVFALNETLKNTAYSPSYVVKDYREIEERHTKFLHSFTLDDVSRFDQGISVALASGGTHSSTASRRTFFRSFPPTSLTRRIASTRASYAVIGAEPSFNMPYCGPSCTFERARSTRKPCLNARKGLRLTSSLIPWTPLAP